MTPARHPIDPPDNTPWIWITALALVVIATRLLMSPAVSWDQNEQLVWSQDLALGYGPQPPLYTWLQWAVNGVLGPTTLAVVLVKNSLLALTFAFMWLAARQVLPARTAWLAAAGLAWLPGMGWQMLRDQTHTVMLTCAIAATWWVLLRQIRAPRPMGFVWIGMVMAWGMLSKYSYLLVAVAALAAALGVPGARRALLSRGWWLAPLVGIALVAPHAWWVLDHWQQASGATLGKLQPAHTQSRWHGLATGSGDLLSFLLLAALPWLAMCRWAFGKFWKLPAPPAADAVPAWVAPLLTRYVLIVVGALVLMVLAGASKFDGRWIQPLLCMVPLWVLARWPQLGANAQGCRRYLSACLAVLALVWCAALLAPLRDAKRGHGDRLNWPLDAMATTLRQAGFDGHGVVIGEHHTTGGVLRLSFPQARIVVCSVDLPGAEACVAQATAQARAQRQPLLLVNTDEPAPAAWWQAAGDGTRAVGQTVHLPYRWTDPAKVQLRLEFALVPPAP